MLVDRVKSQKYFVWELHNSSSLQTMFDSNVSYIHQMEELIISGQLKFNELNEQLTQMDANPAAYNDYEIADMRDFVNRLDKRLADLKVVRFIMIEMNYEFLFRRISLHKHAGNFPVQIECPIISGAMQIQRFISRCNGATE